MNLNQHTIIGFVGGDAECKQLPNGTPVIKFSLATRKSWKLDNGQWDERVQWHNVVAYGKSFAAMAERIKKGSHLLVQGELRTHEYDKSIGDGKRAITIKQLVVETIADTIRTLDRTARAQQSDAAEPPITDEEVPD